MESFVEMTESCHSEMFLQITQAIDYVFNALLWEFILLYILFWVFFVYWLSQGHDKKLLHDHKSGPSYTKSTYIKREKKAMK